MAFENITVLIGALPENHIIRDRYNAYIHAEKLVDNEASYFAANVYKAAATALREALEDSEYSRDILVLRFIYQIRQMVNMASALQKMTGRDRSIFNNNKKLK